MATEFGGLCEILTVRVTEDEGARLRLAADDRGVSRSALVRSIALGCELLAPRPARLDVEAVTSLRKIGSNLNQAVRVLNSWVRVRPEEKQTTLLNLITNIEALRERLDGLARELQK